MIDFQIKNTLESNEKPCWKKKLSKKTTTNEDDKKKLLQNLTDILIDKHKTTTANKNEYNTKNTVTSKPIKMNIST